MEITWDRLYQQDNLYLVLLDNVWWWDPSNYKEIPGIVTLNLNTGKREWKKDTIWVDRVSPRLSQAEVEEFSIWRREHGLDP